MAYVYRLELTSAEYDALCWLADRGYDGDLVKHGFFVRSGDGSAVALLYPEYKAWEVKEAAESSGEAFMTCAGPALVTKCMEFLDSIV